MASSGFRAIPIAFAAGVTDAWLSARDYRDDAAGRPTADPDAFSRVALIGVGAIGTHTGWQPEVSRALLISGLVLGARDVTLLAVKQRNIARNV